MLTHTTITITIHTTNNIKIFLMVHHIQNKRYNLLAKKWGSKLEKHKAKPNKNYTKQTFIVATRPMYYRISNHQK
jgi:hypothetical protein